MIAYRPDIDGLRALAVLMVVAFHAHPAFMQGGYAGVDIFFVISGFLITAIIAKDIKENRFSILDFYERRAKRILPALFTVMGVSAIVAHFLLLPIEYEGFGKSLAATAISGSNFLFWAEAGYFDITANLKPLLHTWSLGIEEQFYIFFPLYMILVFRFCPKAAAALTLAGLILSFFISVWGVSTGREESVFFLLPTRAWELMIGAILALKCLPPVRARWAGHFLSLLGLGLVVFSALRAVASDQYPGANALFPTLGAGLLIYAGGLPMRTVTARFLSLPFMVFIGRMSYSLYLWHWPALVFAQYVWITPMGLFPKAVLLVGVFMLSFLSWRWIEQPCRKLALATPRARTIFFGLIFLMMGVFGAWGLYIYKDSGVPARFPQKVLNYAQAQKGGTYAPAHIATIPATNEIIGAGTDLEKASFIVWGDSHATALSPALDKAAKSAGRTGLFVKEAACFPAFDVTAPVSDFCKKFDGAVQKYIEGHANIRDVFLIARWSAYPRWWSKDQDAHGDESSRALFESEMTRTIKALESSGRTVYIVAEVPYVNGWYVPSVLARGALFGKKIDMRVSLADHLKQQKTVTDIFQSLTKNTHAKIIMPHTKICDQTLCAVEKDGHSLYFDDDHLSTFGGESLSGLFSSLR